MSFAQLPRELRREIWLLCLDTPQNYFAVARTCKEGAALTREWTKRKQAEFSQVLPVEEDGDQVGSVVRRLCPVTWSSSDLR